MSNSCCCGGGPVCCPDCCGTAGPPGSLTATLVTDCGTYTRTLAVKHFYCCDANGQPIDCTTGVFPELNGACVEYYGRLENVDCPVLLNAEGDYGCQGTSGFCVDITVSLMNGTPQACLNMNVRVSPISCPISPGGGTSNYDVGTSDINCAAIDFTTDVSSQTVLVNLVCDHGQATLTITE